MTLEQPLFIDGNNYSGIELRALLESMFNEGVIRGDDFKVTPRAAGANMTVEVLAGRVAIQSDTGGGGVYLARSTAIEPVPNPSGTFTAAPGAGLTRIDVVYARMVAGDLVLGVEEGVAASSPTIPTPPSDSCPLARVTLPSGTISIGLAQITDMRSWATPHGSLPKAAHSTLGFLLDPPIGVFTDYGPTLVLPLGTHPRRLTAIATCSGRTHIATTGPILYEVGIQMSIDRGVSYTSGPVVSGAAPNGFEDQPWTCQHARTGIPPTPGIGTEIEVRARVVVKKVNSGASTDFDRGSLHLSVFPA